MRVAIRSRGGSEAPTVVFLHGLGLLGPRLTDEPADAWATRGFRVLAPDLPGFGGSPAVSMDDYRPSRLARLLLDALPERFAVVGFSWGGTIGVHMAVQAPDRLTALVLVDVGYQTPTEPTPYEQQLEQARAEVDGMRFPDKATFLEAARPHFSPRVPEAALVASMREEGGFLVPELTPEVYAGALHGVEAEPPQPLLGLLAETRVPVLLLVAGQPPRADRADEVAAFRRTLPGAEVLDFPESGHNILVDESDRAIPAVADWLERTPAR